uniref:Leiomodin 2 n=1 Tax=Naja naja TaxID=35670 RepID=A0A8C6X4L3_NAJNA
MSGFGYRRGLSKYEDLDEDELLASLTDEELKELEKELEDIDLTEKTPTGTFSREALMAYWERETKKLLEKERMGACEQKDKQYDNAILKEIKNSLKSIPDNISEEGSRPSSRPSTPVRSLHSDLMEAIRGSNIRQLRRVSNCSQLKRQEQ